MTDEISKAISDFSADKKYGEITLKIEAGKITRIVKTESIKVS